MTFSCPFCGSTEVKAVRAKEDAAKLRLRCRACKRPWLVFKQIERRSK